MQQGEQTRKLLHPSSSPKVRSKPDQLRRPETRWKEEAGVSACPRATGRVQNVPHCLFLGRKRKRKCGFEAREGLFLLLHPGSKS